MIILETNRLYLREFSTDDAEHFYLLNSDPEVTRYTGDSAFENIAAARKFLDEYIYNYSDLTNKTLPIGRWAVITKDENNLIGWCGLKHNNELNEVDLGYRLFRNHWGKGYATEAAKACIKFGHDKLGIKKIVGRAMKLNTASINVLEKCGMTFSHEVVFKEHDGVLYAIGQKSTVI